MEGLLTWKSGGMNGSGKTIASGGMHLTSAGDKWVNGRLVENPGLAVWDEGLLGSFDPTGLGGILNTGRFEIRGDLPGARYDAFSVSVFHNAGQLVKTSGGGTATIGLYLENTGSVEVQAGTLELAAGGRTANSNWSVPVGSALVLGGVFTLDANVGVSGDVILPEWSQGLSGPGDLTVEGLLTWKSGGMNGSGKTIASGGMHLTSAGDKWVNGRLVENPGLAVWDEGLLGSFDPTGLGGILNTGTFEIRGDFEGYTAYGPSVFRNEGQLVKTGGSGTATMALYLENTGSVEVQAGRLELAAGYRQTEGETRLSGGSVSSSVPLDVQGGAVIGSGIVFGNVVSGGHLSPGLATAASLLGDIRVEGDYSQGAGGVLDIEIGGLAAGEYDQFDVTGLITLGGALNVSLIEPFSTNLGDRLTMIDNEGPEQVSGTFAGLAEGAIFTVGSSTFKITYRGGDGNDVALTAVCAVTNTLDSGPGSLRQAILDANAHPGPDTIEFAIPGTGPHTIQPLAQLPTLFGPVTVDGTAQPGFSGKPIVEIDGSLAGNAWGFYVVGSGTTIRGLVINRFAAEAIQIDYGSQNVIQGNYLGTDVTGTIAFGNGGGIRLDWSASNVIGTDGDGAGDAAEGNLISGNSGPGVNFVGASANSGNIVAGNLIGTDVTGRVALGNASGVVVGGDGIRIGTDGNGVSDLEERNIISGNRYNGVELGYGSTGNVVAGNFIGTDATGTEALGNGWGVYVAGADSNLIGTNGDGDHDAIERNVISGNLTGGVFMHGNDNRLAGNYIGTDFQGRSALGNGRGVVIEEGQGNVIGTNGDGMGDDAAEGNVISGNAGNGVTVSDGSGHVLAGNYIGTDANGTVALEIPRMASASVRAQAIRIGTNGDGVSDTAERNVISGNGTSGVYINAGAHDNVVAGNFIGVDATGSQPLGNATATWWAAGVFLDGGGHSNRIGTNGDGDFDETERNVISGNYSFGIYIFGADTYENVIAGNYIGTDVSGAAAVPNSGGVQIALGSHSNLIGTNADGIHDDAERNVISGNTGDGVIIAWEGTERNVVVGNWIGLDAGGTAPLGNGGHGVGLYWGPGPTRWRRPRWREHDRFQRDGRRLGPLYFHEQLDPRQLHLLEWRPGNRARVRRRRHA